MLTQSISNSYHMDSWLTAITTTSAFRYLRGKFKIGTPLTAKTVAWMLNEKYTDRTCAPDLGFSYPVYFNANAMDMYPARRPSTTAYVQAKRIAPPSTPHNQTSDEETVHENPRRRDLQRRGGRQQSVGAATESSALERGNAKAQ
ncbi:hypothetical protein COCVIDRAFT_18296 [Bipolaris victoriae FI3]|uniref:Uncharacterized protein n=1 Tax=Bipolaris victoriae (strain FI3) TaxID=930091 RepID=W7EBC5_BIPV3|nr:hypothetical protein COCVIDRAFT_18296 [Bipolaris victoriae FI3]